MIAPLAVSVAVRPRQIFGLGLLIDSEGGAEFTFTVIALLAVQADAEVAVKTYTVFEVGATTIEEVVAPVLQEKLLTASVVSVKLCPEHSIGLLVPVVPEEINEIEQRL